VDKNGVTAKNKSIAISFQYRGMQCRETVKLNPSYTANLKHAARLKAEVDRHIALGTFSYAEYFPDSRTKTAKLFAHTKTRLTIETALNRYLASVHRLLAPSTYREYTSSSKRIIAGLGEMPVDKVTALEVREWFYSLECSHKRINNILVPLRGMFQDLYADAIIDRNPMDRIKNLSVVKSSPDPFSQIELNRILAEVTPMSLNLIQFAAWTGLRTGELFALTWKDIDIKKKECRVNKSITRGELKSAPKTSSGFRTIELLPKALKALINQKKYSFLAGDHVFLQHDTKEPFTQDDQLRKRVWLRAIKKSGVRYRKPYQLRHTFASTLLSAGANPMWLAQQMGHADWGMIRKTYGKWIPQETSEADRMAAIFNERNGGLNTSATLRETKKP